MSGTETSKKHNSLTLVVNFDPNQSCGMTFENYMEQVLEINLAIYFSNEFLNPYNFDDPIQTLLEDKYRMILDPRVISYKRFYIRK